MDYRKGQAKGAKGEIFAVLDDSPIKHQPEANSIREISIFQDSEDPQTIKSAKGLERYRRAYRQFRVGSDARIACMCFTLQSGSSKGAEGELSKIAAGITG